MPHYHYHYHITYYYLYSVTIMSRKARAFSPHTMTHASRLIRYSRSLSRDIQVTWCHGVRTADQYACGPWSADFSRNWWLEPFADGTSADQNTVQLRTRSMHGLIVAVHLRTQTVRGFNPSDARGCGKIRGRPYCHSANHWTGPSVVTSD